MKTIQVQPGKVARALRARACTRAATVTAAIPFAERPSHLNRSAIPWHALLAAARTAASKAYAPYSRFHVGAALLAEDGRIFIGANVENASYGLTICAERAALFAAVNAGVRHFKALALVAGSREPATPCGACRQVLAEFCDRQMPVICAPLTGTARKRTTMGALLPLGFKLTPRLKAKD